MSDKNGGGAFSRLLFMAVCCILAGAILHYALLLVFLWIGLPFDVADVVALVLPIGFGVIGFAVWVLIHVGNRPGGE